MKHLTEHPKGPIERPQPEQITDTLLIEAVQQTLVFFDCYNLAKAANRLMIRKVKYVGEVNGEHTFEYLPEIQGEIEAACHDDNHVFDVSFNAAAWFMQASSDEILKLAAIDWGGNREADEVALFMDDADSDVEAMFKYIEYVGEDVGFECRVDSDSALKWLLLYRPDVYAAVVSASGE